MKNEFSYTLEELQRLYGRPADWVSHSAKPLKRRLKPWQEHAINFVLESYKKQPTPLSVRQIHYHLVSQTDLGYQNTLKDYNKLINFILRARISGLIPWYYISEEETRVSYIPPGGVKDPKEALKEAIKNAQYSIGIDPWEEMNRYVVVFTEKRELLSQLDYVTNRYYVRLVCFRGYGAWTRIYYESQRIKEMIDEGRDIYLLVVTDHDPSGLDIHRFYGSLLRFFWKLPVEVQRVMLTIQQVQEYELPPWAVKVKDPRAKWYIQKFGHDVWEVDALGRERMQEILEEHIKSLIDWNIWNKVMEENRKKQEEVMKMAEKMLEEMGE